MSSQEISLSIIIPVYNVAAHLDKCLASIAHQNLIKGSYEIILIDDGSTDLSLEVAQNWAEKFPEIKIIRQTNQGQSVARNVGLNQAAGEYIWFIDADDYILYQSAKILLHQAKINNLDLITFDVVHVKVGESTPSSFNAQGQLSSITDGWSYVAHRNYNNSPCLYLIRREYIHQIGLSFVPGRYCEDGIFSADLISRAKHIAHYPSPAYVYVRHVSSTTQTKTKAHAQKVIEDFIYAIGFFEKYIAKQSQNSLITKGYLSRLKSRQDSYTLFLAIRLLKSPLPMAEITHRYLELYDRNWLPIKHLRGDEYPGFRYRIIVWTINRPILFRLVLVIIKTSQWLLR